LAAKKVQLLRLPLVKIEQCRIDKDLDRPEKDSRDLSDSDSRDYALIVFRPRCIDAAAGVLSVDRETETLRISKYE
jgi:hypothetical protein